MSDDSSPEGQRTSSKAAHHRRKSPVAIAVLIWISVFSVSILMGPTIDFFNRLLLFIDTNFGVSRLASQLSIILAFYAAIFWLVFRNPRTINSFRKIIKLIPGISIERSAYDDSRLGEMPQPLREGVGSALSLIINRIANLENTRSAEFRLADDQAEHITGEVINKVTTNLSKETQDSLVRIAENNVIDNLENSSLRRLSDLSVVLGSRARLTLWMGVMVCSFGIAALYFSFFHKSPFVATLDDSAGWFQLASTYAPRFSLVVVIELIGLFFLKLYKSTLGEIRFVQNEITNIEMRLIALHSARGASSEVLAATIAVLASTERNSIIDKTQTTVEIERSKAASEIDKTLLEAAVSLLHGTEKSSFWRRPG